MPTPGMMPTGSAGSPPPPRLGMQGHALSWTDDLPVCYLSGVGFATNQAYREDGFRREQHEFEDRSFHFRVEEDCYLYGVFDGHGGSKASNFAAQRMPAELLLGQLSGKVEDDAVKEVIHQSFIAVEKGFFDSIDDALAEKANLMLHLPEGMKSYEQYTQYPDIYNRLQAIEAEITGGTTAVVTLIYNNNLYVANVGDSRALLCKTDQEGVLRVMQLSMDHTIDNEDELLRLSQLGLDVEKIQQQRKLGNAEYTRCIGDYHIKHGFKEIEILSSALAVPMIAEPEIQGGIPLDESCSFLILMSDGLYKSYEDATGSEHVNADIAAMVAAEFAVQSTLNGVAQAVVDKVVRIHHDAFMCSSDQRKELCQVRGDITLLVRNFNHPLPNAISSPTATAAGGKYAAHPVSVPYSQSQRNGSLSVTIPTNPAIHPFNNGPPLSRQLLHITLNQPTPSSGTLTYTQSTMRSSYTSSNDSTQSSDHPFSRRSHINQSLELDKDGKIEPYISFAGFYQAIAELTEAQRESLNVAAPVCEMIQEEDVTDGGVEDEDDEKKEEEKEEEEEKKGEKSEDPTTPVVDAPASPLMIVE